MDEPLSNLDAKLRVQTRAEIARLHQRLGTTMVYVTHDQVEAMTMGQRIAVMSEGLLQQVGTPQALYDHARQPVRRGLHRQPVDELRRGAGRRRRRRRARRTGRLVDPASRPRYREAHGRRRPARSIAASGRSTSSWARSGATGAILRARADVVEYLGNEELLHVTAAEQGHRRDRRLVAPGQAGRRRQARRCRSTSSTCSTPSPALTLAPDARRRRRPDAPRTAR